MLILALCATLMAQSIPDVIPRLRPGPPVWVSARSALNGDGEFRSELFEKHTLEILNKLRRKNSDRCNEALGSPPLEDFTPKDSLDALVSYSPTIIKARVMASDAGFDNGLPGTLFALRVDETYKSVGQAATRGPLYVFIGEATIPTAAGIICSKSFRNPPPAVGDEIIVFCSVYPIDNEGRILHVDESHQFVLQHAGRLYLPQLTGDSLPPATGIEDLGGLIRANPHLHDVH
jgi:hypothetical protein